MTADPYERLASEAHQPAADGAAGLAQISAMAGPGRRMVDADLKGLSQRRSHRGDPGI
jgi:hypothetical protein